MFDIHTFQGVVLPGVVIRTSKLETTTYEL